MWQIRKGELRPFFTALQRLLPTHLRVCVDGGVQIRRFHFHWPWNWILFIISSDTYYSVRRDSNFDCSIKEWVHSLKSITFLFKHVYFNILSEDVCNNFLCWSLQPAMTGRLVLDKSVNTIQHKNRGPGWTRVLSTDESHWHHGWCDPVARLSLFICFLGLYMYCL